MNFQMLSTKDVEQIHEATLAVLERTGVKVCCGEAVELLKRGGCKVTDGERVRIPGKLVEKCLKSTAKGFRLYNREGEKPLEVGGRNVYFGTGVTNPNVLDYRTGQRRATCVRDIAEAAKVSEYLENLDWIMPLGSVQDVPAGAADVHEFEAAVSNTHKPIVFICSDVRGVEQVLKMAEVIAGGKKQLTEKPFVVAYPEPTSPLLHTQEAVEKLLYCAEYGVPIIYTPCTMAGATAPVTLAGSLVQANAECLSGLVMAQLKGEGAAIVIGGVLSVIDMSTTSMAYGAPEMSMLLAGMGDIARYYGLPTWGTAGCSDAKRADTQAAIELTFSSVINGLGGLNLVHDPGFLENGLVGSLEVLVMTNEVAGMVKRVLKGIVVDKETLAVGVIDEVGPGGHYLEHEHTLKHFREELWRPTLMNRQTYGSWLSEGGRTMEQRVKERIADILENRPDVGLPKDMAERVAEIRRESIRQRA